MFVNFNEKYVAVFAANISYPLQCFYLLNYKIWGTTKTGVQDQNQGRPRAMRTHSNQRLTSCWRVAEVFELVWLQEEDRLNMI